MEISKGLSYVSLASLIHTRTENYFSFLSPSVNTSNIESKQVLLAPFRMDRDLKNYLFESLLCRFSGPVGKIWKRTVKSLWLGLPSTLIQEEILHWKKWFLKTIFKPEELYNANFAFLYGRKTFWKNNGNSTYIHTYFIYLYTVKSSVKKYTHIF